jgi:hypothetical protein
MCKHYIQNNCKNCNTISIINTYFALQEMNHKLNEINEILDYYINNLETDEEED